MLEHELAQVNNNVKLEIEKVGLFQTFNIINFLINKLSSYLFLYIYLAFDGWTSHTHRSIWNFIIMTPKRKEYLYQLSDISDLSHIAECISSIIEKVIIDIGANRILAVVSDNASNVRKAQKIIQNKFSNIENVWCIVHYIILIVCDIVKDNFEDRLLR